MADPPNWSLAAVMDMEYIKEVLERGRGSMTASPVERVHLALSVLPELVSALDEMVRWHDQFKELRAELTQAVGDLRTEAHKAMKETPDETFRNARVQSVLRRINGLLDRIDKEIFG